MIPKKLRYLKLNEEYIFEYSRHFFMETRVKFIKVTKCGYNFLNVDTGKCILKKHIYKFKKIEEDRGNIPFLLPVFMEVKKIKNK